MNKEKKISWEKSKVEIEKTLKERNDKNQELVKKTKTEGRIERKDV